MSTFIGLMSGTSLDGVDGVVAHFGDDPAEHHIAVSAHAHRPFDPVLRDELLALNRSGADELHRAALAANGLARVQAEVVQALLAQAGLAIGDMAVIKTHNPFALNDLLFARVMGVDWQPLNPYGCSLVWGHPQAPMGTRAIIELIETLALRGGGRGLFTGCAAGDTAMAVVVEVGDA